MKKLIVIGNGFDKAHGLETGYENFKAYLQSEHYDFYHSITKYIDAENLWYSFEDALGTLDSDTLQESNYCYLTGYSDEDWRDNANHDYQYEIQMELSFASHISSYLCEWIKSINTHISPKSHIIIFDDNCIFLSFNYTDTLETVYGISEDRILYIHGKAMRGDPLIVGHHDADLFCGDSNPSPNKWAQYHDDYLDDIREIEARKIIKSYFQETYKDTGYIIRNNRNFFDSLCDVDEVWIIGHSMSHIDFDYFAEIKKQVSRSCKWNITCHDLSDRERKEKILRKLELKQYSFFDY